MFGGESPIGGRPCGRRLVGEHAVGLFGWPLLRDAPRAGAIDAVAVGLQPAADAKQQIAVMVGNRTVRARSNVEQQVAVFRNRVDQCDKQFRQRLVFERFRIAPGIAGDCRVRLPDERRRVGESPALHVHDAGAPGEAIILVADRDVPAPFGGTVVVERRELAHVRLERRMLHPPIEIQQFRMVVVDDLAVAQQPILKELVSRMRLAMNVEFVRFGHGGPVEVAFAQRFADVGIEILAMPHEPPMFGAMVRCGEMHAVSAGGITQLAQHVAVRAGFRRVPMGQLAAIHLVSVMVFGDRAVVARAGGSEQVEPRVRIESFGGEHRNEILIAERGLRSVSLPVVFEFRVAFDVHVARIPFVAVFGHGVETPVGEDAEFGVGEPSWRRSLAQRLPGVGVGTGGDDGLDGVHIHH